MAVTIDGTNGINDTVLGSSTPAAASVTTFTGTTVTAQTAFVPDASDGAALGTTALEFSDLFLADGAVINLGDDQDVTITHVADAGIMINAAMQLRFRDSAISISSTADGDLSIAADDEIDITSTLIDINGNLDVSGTALITGVTTHGDDVVSDTDSTDDLGTTGVRWANLFVDAITATDQITATGFTGTLDGILGSGAAAAATTTTLASTTITASGIIKTDDTTAATSTTDGSLQTDGGLSVVLDAVIGDDLIMLSDAAQIAFGADKDVTLTHVADTGISLNSKDIAGVASINKGQIGGRRNIVYNGEMKVAQRSASVTGLGAAAGYFTLDRWIADMSTAGRFTMAQVADGPPGFANSLKITTTTADTSIAAGEYFVLQQRLEGQDLQQLKKGTASAEQVTVSFYVKGNANAIYVCELAEFDNTRNITQSFAVTTSWNRIELTFAADTTGALDDDNAASLFFSIWLHAGATYTGGTFASNTWAGITNANRAAVDDFTSIFDATSRTFFITGVQMEIGATATEFESRTFGEELALCQRYTWKYGGNISDEYLEGVGFYADGNQIIFGHIRHPVIMRTTPTLTVVGSPIIKINGGATTGFTPVISAPSALGGMINMQKNSHGLTASSVTALNTPGTGDHFFFVAEL